MHAVSRAAGTDHRAAVRRWRDELIALLAAQAPRLDHALKKGARQGGEVVLIDGTLIATQRRTGKADRRNPSGKHHHHGLHFLALTDERGRHRSGYPPPGPAAPATTPPPARITSWPTCAPPASGPWRTSVSAAWTATYAIP
ncbi:hypothetical protein [Streptomyces sp. NPDC059009]|uniref:hypothetical protein n=1 Tax=Streptomyces sp. NPDC059009 TaxID=3346694 RepID=UPI003685CAEF